MPSDPAARTPSDSAGAPDVDTLEAIAIAQAHAFEQNERRIQAVSDLAAIARQSDYWKRQFEEYQAANATFKHQGRDLRDAKAEADRLARRVAELEAALRETNEEILDFVRSQISRDARWQREAKDKLIARVARAKLAGDGGGA